MPSTIASVYLEFPEVRTSVSPAQTAWTAFVLCGYGLAAFLSVIGSIIAPERVHENPQRITNVVLVPPVSKPDAVQIACAGECDGSHQPPVAGIKVDMKSVKLGVADDPSFEIL